MSTTYERRKQISVQRNAARAEHLKTPAMRRAEAQAAAARSRAARQAQEAEQKAKISAAQDNVNPLLRGLSTSWRVQNKLITGALGAVEGIVDLGIGAVGAVGGLVSEDFREGAKQAVQYNATEQWVGKHLDELTKYSYTEGNKAGEIVEGVAEGVGQMLPAVIATVATGGAAAGSMAGGAAKLGAAASKLGMGITMASAAGNATQQAYEDGADYYEGLGYGVASGAVEGATEKLTGGVANKLTGFGKGIIKDSAGKVASQGIKRIAKEAVGEGAEEALAELANPMLKTIYKGKDAINEYGKGEYWQGVGESALVGALTSVAFGQTVGRAVGGNADINASLEAIQETNKTVAKRNAEGKSTGDRASTQAAVGENYLNIERVLKKASPEKRAKLIEQYELDGKFDADGTLRADFAARNGFAVSDGKAIANDTQRLPEQNLRYVAPSLQYDAEQIAEDIRSINADIGEGADVALFGGELSENGENTYTKLKQMVYNLSDRTGTQINVSIVTPNNSFNGVTVKGRNIYISADVLENADKAESLLNGFDKAYRKNGNVKAHSVDSGVKYKIAKLADGKQYVKADRQVFSGDDPKEWGKQVTEYINDTIRNGKDITVYAQDGDALTITENTAGKAAFRNDVRLKDGTTRPMTDEEYAVKLRAESHIDEISQVSKRGNKTVPDYKRHAFAKDGFNYRTAYFMDADGKYYRLTLSVGKNGIINTVYNVGKIKEEGEYSLSGSKPVTDKSDTMRSPSSKNSISQNPEKSTGIEKKSTAPGTVIHEVGHVAEGTKQYGELMKLLAEDEALVSDTIDMLIDDKSEYGYTKEIAESCKNKLNNGGKLTVIERSFISEIGAHMSEKLLSEDEVFIEKLVRGNTTVAEKTLNMIAEAKRAVASLQSSDTRAKYNRLRRAEKLYLKAVSAAGMTYRNGKITRREEEKTIEFSRMNSRSFSENVRAISKMTDEHAQENLSQGNFVSVMKHTPSVILDNVKDAEDLEVIVRFDAIYLATRKEGVAKGHYHDLGVEVASKIPEFISNPDAIIRLDNGRINLLARMTDTNGKQGIISVELNTVKDINSQYTKYNLVISAFNAKDNYIKNVLRKATKLEYKKEDLPQVNPQLYEWLTIFNEVSSKDSISQPDEKVNPKSQFSRKSAPQSENERVMKRISNEIRKEVNQGQPATASMLLKDNLKLSKNLESSQNKVKSLKEENKNIQEYAKACNRCIYLVNQIKDLKSERYVSSSEYQNHAFKEGFEKLSKLLWRGNIRNTLAVREELKKLYDWYVNPKNRLFHDESGNKTEDFNHVLVNTLEELGSGEGSFTVNDIKALEKTLEAVKHHIDTYNKVWNGERWIDTRDEGVRFVRSIERNKEYRGGWYYRFFASGKYQRTFADNASVFRAADCYDEHGFFTEYFEALREGLIGTQIAEMELREELESFYKKHKNYVKRLTKDKIEYKGKDIAVRQYLSLYMTAKRKQSYLAFAKTGFKLHDEKGNAVNFGPLASDPASIESEEQAQAHVEKMRKELEQKLTKEDLEYVAILERAYVKCAELKREMDMIRWGYSNVISSYYYPIKKADTAENVDESFFIEVERTSNLSFNKSTVKNAGRLFIEPVDTVFNRHVRGIALYSNLAMTVENMNRVLNVNVSDTSQSNSLRRQIKENKYLRDTFDALKKLKNDIEGMRIVEDAEMSRFIGKLRSNYARSVLAANPKIFLTQLSSFFAATSILNYQNMVKGFGVSNKSAEVDKYCSLAKLRNTDNTVVKAQTVSDKAGKISDVLLTPVGKIDRWVVVELFGGCQVQIEAEGGPKVGTEANKIEAGKLLERVILETQQNTLLTEKSAAMRSSQEYMKFLTMFSADAMKVMGRVYDGMGEVTVLKAKSRALKADPNKNAATIAALQKERDGVTEELNKKREEQAENDSDARLLDNAKQILQMKSVKDLKGDEFADDGKHSLRDRVVAFFDSFGNKVLSEELGEVSVTRSSFRDDKAHGLTYNKVISFAAVPEVLKSGKIIDIWKPSGKPYERITVAAPITIGEKKYYMGVMVQKDIQSNRMYLHDVIREEATLSFTTEPTAKNGEGIRDEGHLFITSVLQNALKVNRELKKNIPDLENQIADLENRAAALDKQIEELKNEPAQTEKKLKQAKKKLARSTAALAASSVFMAAIALFFKWLYGKTRDEEKADIAKDTLFDLFGNMLGGLPLVRDIYSAIAEGFDVDVFNMSALNDLIDSCRECYELAAMAASGDEVTDTDVRSAMKKSLSAVGMMFGIPVRNTYNLVTGLTKRISPSAGYWIDSQFYSQTYTSDLKEAIENDDEKMISTIAGLITGENFDGVGKAAQSSVRELISKGYTGVLPRSVGDTVTYDGEQIELSARQKKRFREVYGIADESMEILVSLSEYREADDEVKAKAIKFIYDTYYGLALEELVGAENSKLTLFAEAFDIEKLALIISTARSFESDKDKNGKVIQGSKKAKIIKYLESLRMSAAQKHMLLGFLGYNQTKGREKVEAYIGTLRLTKDEKAALLEHSGYAVA